jgi:hypothetical protein
MRNLLITALCGLTLFAANLEIGNIEQVGGAAKLEYTRDNNGVVVTVPVKSGDTYAVALKISPQA